MTATSEKAPHRWGYRDTEFIAHGDRTVELTGSRYEICGAATEVRAQRAHLKEVAAKHQGFFAGASNGKRGYNLTFAIAYIRDFMSKLYVLGETLETTLPWDEIHSAVEAVRREADRIHRDHALAGKLFLSYRITQLYASGACVHFTYAASLRGAENATAVAGRAEHRLRRAIMQSGGAASNHHGVGKLCGQALASVLPPMNADVIRGMKQVVDPGNVFGARNGVFCQGFLAGHRDEVTDGRPRARFGLGTPSEAMGAEPRRQA